MMVEYGSQRRSAITFAAPRLRGQNGWAATASLDSAEAVNHGLVATSVSRRVANGPLFSGRAISLVAVGDYTVSVFHHGGGKMFSIDPVLPRIGSGWLGWAAVWLGCVAIPLCGHAADGFEWTVDEPGGTALLRCDGQPVIQYQFAYDPSTKERLHETFKVFHHVYGPGSADLITKGPGGAFTHHRGLFVGWMRTTFDDGQWDFWHCHNGAHQRHRAIVSQDADAEHGRMTTEIHWNDPEGKPVVVEQRTVDVVKRPIAAAPGYGWQIDWTSELSSQRGQIELNGDRQHAGFQFRAAQEVAEKNSARYIRPSGFPEQPTAFEVDDRKSPDSHINLGWLAMQTEIAGKPYTIVYQEHPQVPKPSRFSERPYGRFGAFFVTEIAADRPLRMAYRVIVLPQHDVSRDQLQVWYDEFAATPPDGD
jgi:hypothetical protein